MVLGQKIYDDRSELAAHWEQIFHYSFAPEVRKSSTTLMPLKVYICSCAKCLRIGGTSREMKRSLNLYIWLAKHH